MKQLDYNKLMATEWARQFDDDQLEEIQEGLEMGLDVSFYARPEFDWKQMFEIRIGLKDGLDVSLYATTDYDDQMEQIRLGLTDRLDVSHYASPEIHHCDMDDIRMELLRESEGQT